MKLLLIITTLLFSPHTSNQLSSVVGTVVSIEKTSKTVTIKNDQNVSVLIQASDTTVCLRIPAGAQSLEQATPIQFDEVAVGDRVLSRGTKNENNFSALRIVVLSKDDVAKRREKDLEQWRTRGVAGVVKSLDAEKSEINVELRGSGPSSTLRRSRSNSLAQFTPLGTGGSAATSNRSFARTVQFLRSPEQQRPRSAGMTDHRSLNKHV